MKKFLLAIVAIAALAFVGCDKEGGSDELAGTKWVSTFYHGETSTIEFQSGGKVSFTMQDEEDTYRFSGTYTYESPKVYITLQVGPYTAPIVGTILGNKMSTVEGDGEDAMINEYTKQ